MNTILSGLLGAALLAYGPTAVAQRPSSAAEVV